MTDPHLSHDARQGDQPPQAAAVPAYPLALPGGDDPRFTVGLALDVAAVLASHGYPHLAGGGDLTHWQHTLFTGLYTNHSKETTA